VYALKRASNRATFTKLELIFTSIQRTVSVDGQCGFYEQTAVLCPQSGTGLAEGKSGQAEHDWPLKVTGLRQQTGSFLPPAKQHHFPGCFSGHHFCSGYSSSSFSEDGGPLTDNVVFSGVQPLFPREAGIATWAVLAQPCVH